MLEAYRLFLLAHEYSSLILRFKNLCNITCQGNFGFNNSSILRIISSGIRPLCVSPAFSAACLARTRILCAFDPRPVSSGAPSSLRSRINTSSGGGS